MIDYARLKPGPGFEAGRSLLYYSQRLVTNTHARRLIAAVLASCVGIGHRRAKCAAPASAAVEQTADALMRDGFAMVDPVLSERQVADIRRYLASEDVVLRDGRRTKPDTVPNDVTSADYPLETVLRCPHVLEFANNAFALAVAGQYIGCVPTISTIGIRWSFPGSGAGTMTQGFHRDPDDWRFVKLFTHLTDIDPSLGPHVYVRGSHRTSGTVRSRPYTADELSRDYGTENIQEIVGSAGTAFMADTYGIHKGTVPSAGPRLMLEAGFSILPIFALRYRPMAIGPRPALDRYVNRLLLA
jgi:hypothetical protein